MGLGVNFYASAKDGILAFTGYHRIRILSHKTSTSQLIFVVMLVVCLAVLSLIFVKAQRGRNSDQQVRPRATTPGGREIFVKPNDNLQSAVRRAQFGDSIVLEAGATYVGPLILPFKTGGTGSDSDYITIRTSNLTSIAVEGDRINPKHDAVFMPKIVSPSNGAAIGT